MEDFERELRQALERRPAPPSLKRQLMEGRGRLRPRSNVVLWQRLAAALALAASVAGGAAGYSWHERQERRRGEAAREQVLTALRITGHALNRMNAQLAARGRAEQEGESR